MRGSAQRLDNQVTVFPCSPQPDGQGRHGGPNIGIPLIRDPHLFEQYPDASGEKPRVIVSETSGPERRRYLTEIHERFIDTDDAPMSRKT